MTARRLHDAARNNPEARAKLFKNGRSQAVRLPQAFRFDGTEVSIRRDGESVILEPIRKREWPAGYWERVDEISDQLDLDEMEPLGGSLMDVQEDES